MNIALLLKWWWRFKDPSYQGIWKIIICHNYYTQHYSIPLSLGRCSFSNIGECSSSFVPHTGKNIKLWTDVWSGQCSLATQYPYLFSICIHTDISLQEMLEPMDNRPMFYRQLTGMLLVEWQEILLLLQNTKLSEGGTDEIKCRWNNQGSLKVKCI